MGISSHAMKLLVQVFLSRHKKYSLLRHDSLVRLFWLEP